MSAAGDFLRTARVGRRTYAVWGIVLVLVKYNIDRAIAAYYGHTAWAPWNYYLPAGRATVLEIAPADRAFFLALALTAVPFALTGLVLTVLRLRSAGWPLWLVSLFFLPVVNILFFAVLCWMPPADQPRPVEHAGIRGWLRWILPRGRLPTAAAATLLTSMATALLTWVSVERIGSYGWALFFALPFVAGFVAVLLASVREPCSYKAALTLSLLTVAVSGLLLLAFAIEGIICLVMALPIALVMALLGGTVAFMVQAQAWQSHQSGIAMCILVAALPAAFFIDKKLDAPARQCVTEVRIAATPGTVWDHVIAFSQIPPPHEWVFKAGIAYPIEAVINGEDVGAIRRCRFSTGDFVEPITVWDPPRRLAFSVASQPAPMQEISPYGHLHPPHLNGYLISERGEFFLEPLPGGGTLLRGTTWYRQRLWPQFYWSRFSDYLIHAIHRRVLEHIRIEAEAGTASARNLDPLSKTGWSSIKTSPPILSRFQ